MHVQVAAAHLHVAVLAERGGEPLDRRLGGARLAAEDRKYAHRLARTAATHRIVAKCQEGSTIVSRHRGQYLTNNLEGDKHN